MLVVENGFYRGREEVGEKGRFWRIGQEPERNRVCESFLLSRKGWMIKYQTLVNQAATFRFVDEWGFLRRVIGVLWYHRVSYDPIHPPRFEICSCCS